MSWFKRWAKTPEENGNTNVKESKKDKKKKKKKEKEMEKEMEKEKEKEKEKEEEEKEKEKETEQDKQEEKEQEKGEEEEEKEKEKGEEEEEKDKEKGKEEEEKEKEKGEEKEKAKEKKEKEKGKAKKEKEKDKDKRKEGKEKEKEKKEGEKEKEKEREDDIEKEEDIEKENGIVKENLHPKQKPSTISKDFSDAGKDAEPSTFQNFKDSEAVFGPIYPELICFGCTKLFLNPFLLPCDDTVCENCMLKMKSAMKMDRRGHVSVRCPICKTEFHFDSAKEVKFPENYLLRITVAQLRQKFDSAKLQSMDQFPEESRLFCQLCDRKFSRSFITKCITCNLNYCNYCLETIHGNKAFMTHTLGDAFLDIGHHLKCYLHPEKDIILYCITDSVLLCEDCYNCAHETHSTRCLQDAFQTQTKEILALVACFHKDFLGTRFTGDNSEIL